MKQQALTMKIFKDMDDNQYWMTIWSFGFVAFSLLVICISIVSITEDRLVHRLADKGYDLMELGCLYNMSEPLEPACMILAQAKATKLEAEINAIK